MFATRPAASSTSITATVRPASVTSVCRPLRANRSSEAPTKISIPSSSSAAWSDAAASVSARAAICRARSTTVTREPNRANVWANSSPTAPAPTTSRLSGSSSRSSAVTWSIHGTSSSPGTGGTAVREPVARRIRSDSSVRPSTRTLRASTSSAIPLIAV
jgi:hypothetical protein